MKHLICALGVVALGALPASASTMYDFGSATTIALSDEATSYSVTGTNGIWTEDTNGPANEQIDCVVPAGSTADVCGTTGTHLGAAANVSITAPTGSLPTCSTNCGYLLVDGDPDYGAPVSTALTGLVSGNVYTISFYQAATEEAGVTTPTAYDDSWQVYLLPSSAAPGVYLCPNAYCTSHSTNTAALDSGDLAWDGSTSPARYMADTAGGSTAWEQESFTFTANASSEILEFVTHVATSADGAIASGAGFEPPMLGLADVTLTQDSTTPEPSSWVLTGLGLGLVFLTSRLRRRSSVRG